MTEIFKPKTGDSIEDQAIKLKVQKRKEMLIDLNKRCLDSIKSILLDSDIRINDFKDFFVLLSSSMNDWTEENLNNKKVKDVFAIEN